MASSRPWPFDEDRPSGSVRPLRQADLQAILAHLGDDPDELLAGTDADRPVVAVRVRATVGHPGGSTRARWRRLRAAEWAAWMRTLPWRVAAILCIGAAGGLLGSLLAPRLGLVVGGLAALAAGWGLRFRASPDAVAWRRGAAGERRTARLLNPLERHGWVILHDLALPGSRANIDHFGDRARRGVRSPGARWSPTACRSWRPGACQACFSASRRCWGPSGSPGWPTRPGSASTPPANR